MSEVVRQHIGGLFSALYRDDVVFSRETPGASGQVASCSCQVSSASYVTVKSPLINPDTSVQEVDQKL